MKYRQNLLSALIPLAAVLCLVFDGRTAIAGGNEGVMLCLQSVIPSLFPFFVITPLLIAYIENNSGGLFAKISRLLRISPNQMPYFITSLLSGYPVGAKNIKDGYLSGNLAYDDATRMLCFCNNAGPAFLFGICGGLFQNKGTPWIIWAIHILSAAIIGVMMPGGKKVRVNSPNHKISLMESFQNAIRSISSVCGWVILFKVYLAIAEKWILWLLPDWAKILLIGFMELTNGCLCLYLIPSEDIRFLLCCLFINFGGLCVWMQTLFVIQPLDCKSFVLGKVIQTAIAFVMAVIVITVKDKLTGKANYPVVLTLLCLFAAIYLTLKITVALQKKFMYNKPKNREACYAVSKEN